MLSKSLATSLTLIAAQATSLKELTKGDLVVLNQMGVNVDDTINMASY